MIHSVLRYNLRRHPAMDFAERLAAYQQEHRDLMFALFDDGVSAREFERRSARLFSRLNELKRMKTDRRRDH